MIAEPSAPVGRKRGGVYAFKHQVPVGIDKCAFALGIGSPQQEYQVFFLFCDLADNGIGESFPAFVLVRTGLVGPYGKFGFDFYLVDTAGIRRKNKVSEDLAFIPRWCR